MYRHTSDFRRYRETTAEQILTAIDDKAKGNWREDKYSQSQVATIAQPTKSANISTEGRPCSN